jgi:hypothetical protein
VASSIGSAVIEPRKELAFRFGAEALVDFPLVADVGGEVKRITDAIGARGVLVTATQGYRYTLECTGTRVGAKIVRVAIRKCPSLVN